MKRIAIIGAGLAGTACAHVLKGYGFEPVIYEAGAEIASGASGNPVGLYNPRLSAARTAEAEFYISAFALALRTFPALFGVEWNKCGSLHLMIDEKKEKRFRECAANWGWPKENMRLVDAREASSIAGVEIKYGALWMPDVGTVSPRALCEAYAQDVEIHFNRNIQNLSDIKADAVILACGAGIKNFEETNPIPINEVRGQVTQIAASEISKNIKCNLCYGGYMAPAIEGIHTVGATFQRWLNHSDILPEDDADNIGNMIRAIPALAGEYKVMGHRAALRAAAPDHFPIVGAVAENVYVSAAHGSHGILSSLIAAHIIADLIRGGAMGLPSSVTERLSLRRFV